MAPSIPLAGGLPLHGLRAADHDRHEAVRALSDHFAEGRLDLEEFTARMDRAQQVVYVDDLDPLFADLPARPAPQPPAVRQRRRRPPPWLPVALLLIVALTVGSVAGGHFPWWLAPLAWVVAIRRFNGHRHPRRYQTR